MSRRGKEKNPPEKTEEEREKEELEAFEHGPLSLLTQAVENQTHVMISCRNNKILIGRVKAFDRHCNMVLENVREKWTEVPKKGKPITKDRFIPKMFLRGDSVILVVRDPLAEQEKK